MKRLTRFSTLIFSIAQLVQPLLAVSRPKPVPFLGGLLRPARQ